LKLLSSIHSISWKFHPKNSSISNFHPNFHSCSMFIQIFHVFLIVMHVYVVFICHNSFELVSTWRIFHPNNSSMCNYHLKNLLMFKFSSKHFILFFYFHLCTCWKIFFMTFLHGIGIFLKYFVPVIKIFQIYSFLLTSFYL
jgi:hypothetical protein